MLNLNKGYYQSREFDSGPVYDKAYYKGGSLKKYRQDNQGVLAFVSTLESGKLLDVGCGVGYFLELMDDRFQKYGTEVSEYAIKQAFRSGRIYNGQLYDGIISDDTMDVIVMNHVIEHMANPLANLQRAHSILKDGGKLVVGTPDFDAPYLRHVGSKHRLFMDETHISLFTQESMYRALRDHGFKVDFIDYPFYQTRHFTKMNFERQIASHPSAAAAGNFITFYCTRA